MASKYKGRPSKVWTLEQRARQSELKKAQHRQKVTNFAMPPKKPESLTEDEFADALDELRSNAQAACDFAISLQRLMRLSSNPAAIALFKAAGINDVETMRDVSLWVMESCIAAIDTVETDLHRRLGFEE